MKYYLIAGERSGDLHGSNLMKELAKLDTEAEFRFFGGDYMSAVGGEPSVHYKQLAFMGFLEVLKNIPTIRRYLKFCKNDIMEFAPDAIILIDYAGFNLRIAKWATRKKFRVLYYISPKLWAWNRKRAYKIKKYVSHMFAIMPFEVDFYEQFDYNKVSYVGNPVKDAIAQFTADPDFPEKQGITSNNKSLIAVLPGSRKQELSYILPEITSVIKGNPHHTFLVAAVDNLEQGTYDELKDLENVKLIIDNTYNILAIADAAIVTSGTATLETALWDVPQVVVYKGSSVSMLIAKLLIKVKYISLVNLILDDSCVLELIQNDCTPENIEAGLNKILDDRTDYSRLNEIIGNLNASENAASRIFSIVS